jgi:hypothetical protein
MMITMPPDTAPDPAGRAGPPDSGAMPVRPARSQDDKQVLPVRSQDDTDVGWGERPEAGDDERLNRDRPPHWDSA